jgi:S1-C subfamily serine protease
MSLQISGFQSFLVICLLAMRVLPTQTDSPGASIKSIASLEALSYTRVTDSQPKTFVEYGEVRALFDSCRSFERSFPLLDTFREPIRTRGETGIAIFKKASPSVVLVVTANFKDDKVSDAGLGTGVIVDPSGFILTNWHVIHGFESAIIFLKPASGTEPEKKLAYGVKLVAEDESTDLALLKMTKPPAGLPAIRLGDIASVQVAEDIHVIGHPHGQLWSYSTGVISQVRDKFDWEYDDGSKHVAKVLQMQTAINPGNSGGPVLDNDAALLGLVAMSEEGQNLNYAVAVDVIKSFVDRSITLKTRGTSARPATSADAEYFVAKTNDGLTVLKSVYPGLTIFFLSQATGKPVAIVAKSPNEGSLSGSTPDSFGEFTRWTFTPNSGREIFLSSRGGAPGAISLAATE